MTYLEIIEIGDACTFDIRNYEALLLLFIIINLFTLKYTCYFMLYSILYYLLCYTQYYINSINAILLSNN